MFCAPGLGAGSWHPSRLNSNSYPRNALSVQLQRHALWYMPSACLCARVWSSKHLQISKPSEKPLWSCNYELTRVPWLLRKAQCLRNVATWSETARLSRVRQGELQSLEASLKSVPKFVAFGCAHIETSADHRAKCKARMRRLLESKRPL